jgi:hypothetical protein
MPHRIFRQPKASGFFDLRRVPSHTSGGVSLASREARFVFLHASAMKLIVPRWRRPLAGYLPAVSDLMSAARNIDAIRSLRMNPPDHLVFATWHIHSTKNLPETSPEAFTHLIDY